MATEQNRNGDRSALLDEIRFTKQQMLAVGGFGLALIFGIFGLAHDAKLDGLERAVVVGTFWLPVIAGANVSLHTSTPFEDNPPHPRRNR